MNAGHIRKPNMYIDYKRFIGIRGRMDVSRNYDGTYLSPSRILSERPWDLVPTFMH